MRAAINYNYSLTSQCQTNIIDNKKPWQNSALLLCVNVFNVMFNKSKYLTPSMRKECM